MPELRQDPLNGTWVIIAPERQIRPHYISVNGENILQKTDCPFCVGNENMTPPELYTLRKPASKPNMPGWQVRVFPNKYPALRIEEEIESNFQKNGFYNGINGIGAHEVVVETPLHDIEWDALSVDAITDIWRVYQKRINDLKQDSRFRYVQLFKNSGARAGATNPHPHSQILTLPIIPEAVQQRLNRANEYYQKNHQCFFCALLNQELTEKQRILLENKDYVAVIPFAANFSFQVMIYPRQHNSSLENVTDKQLPLLAEILQEILKRFKRVLDQPAFNMMLHNSPFNADTNDYFHWHVELIPIISGTGGYELATHSYINAIPPEEAVKLLQKI